MKKRILMVCLLGSLTVANAATKIQADTTLGADSSVFLDSTYFTEGDFAISFTLEDLTHKQISSNMYDIFTWLPSKGLDMNISMDLTTATWKFEYGMVTSDWVTTDLDVMDPLSGTFVFQYVENGDDATYTFSQLTTDGTGLGTIVSKTTIPFEQEPDWTDFGEVSIYFAGDGSNVSNLTIWSGEVLASDLTGSTDTPAIPEPTTATLSLLALAGLAARRRRR